ADEDVGPKARRLAAQLALQPDRSAKQRRQADLQHEIEPEDLNQSARHHQSSPAFKNPIRSRTSAMVRRARLRALSAPARSRAITPAGSDRKSTRLNSSHEWISY